MKTATPDHLGCVHRSDCVRFLLAQGRMESFCDRDTWGMRKMYRQLSYDWNRSQVPREEHWIGTKTTEQKRVAWIGCCYWQKHVCLFRYVAAQEKISKTQGGRKASNFNFRAIINQKDFVYRQTQNISLHGQFQQDSHWQSHHSTSQHIKAHTNRFQLHTTSISKHYLLIFSPREISACSVESKTPEILNELTDYRDYLDCL